MLRVPPHNKTLENDYWQLLRENILANKLLIFFVLSTGIACFGFPVSNFSVGIDDPLWYYYLYTTHYASMIQQGRLMHVLLNKLTHAVRFVPFFPDFIGASLYVFSALLFCGLFQYICRKKFSTASLLGFACVYISSSILAEKFIYQLDVIVTMFSYCAMALALLYSYRVVKEGQYRELLPAVLALMAAISSYESFIGLYIGCVFSIFLLEMLVNGEKKCFRECLLQGLSYAAILLVSMGIYYTIVAAAQILTGQFGRFSNLESFPPEISQLTIFRIITDRLYQRICILFSAPYLPVRVLIYCALVGCILCTYWGHSSYMDIGEIFRMHGYDFLREPSQEQIAAAKAVASELPIWPSAGYFREFEDFILVNYSE